ncbi:MAG TPA: DNA mismatch repair endonuclease MutL, partial [Nitrospirota bacterium]|nr:DNA mismatch repair endonuclease MutL [Nitrospirota bacterium]
MPIKILPDHVINKIAAGEVVERPASVVKELVENALDAGAGQVFIDIEQSGTRLIRITDNGCGMSREDARLAFERHATSKIASDADLESIRTMGFRGEALSSIASVSRVRLNTATAGAATGTLIEREAGRAAAEKESVSPAGTCVEVSNLFYNTPARLKFLKSAATEFSHITAVVSRLAMANPAVHIRLAHNRKTVLDLPPSPGEKERAFQLYGGEISENIIPFTGGRDKVHVHGLIGRPAYSRSDKTYQDFFVNGRVVKNPTLTHALYAAYGDMLMKDRHPVGFVFLELDPGLVDVNVHPAKAEVRFRNQSQVHDLVRDAIREGLRAHGVPVLEPVDRGGEGHAAAVQEAVVEYLRSQQDAQPPRSSFLFGRRRTDAPTNDPLEFEHRSPVLRETYPPLQPHSAALHGDGLYPLAQIHDSFIIAQSREGMALIDQHAAHERILFEKLQEQFGTGHMPVQNLLIPDQVELGAAQGALLIEYLPELQKLGFVVEHFGAGTFMIKGVPSLLVGADYKKLLLDILDEVNVHGRSSKLEALRDEILSVMACHPA